MAIQKQLHTIEDFERFSAQPENADRLFELINGEIVEKMPTEDHGIVAGIFITAFNIYLKSNPIGRAAVEVRHRAAGDEQNDYIPDVSFISNKHALPVTKKGAVPRMPDLLVEIKSPDDNYLKMREKALYYLKNSSQMVILVFLEKRQIEVHTEESIITLGMNDTLDGGEVLPGFILVVRDIFAV